MGRGAWQIIDQWVTKSDTAEVTQQHTPANHTIEFSSAYVNYAYGMIKIYIVENLISVFKDLQPTQDDIYVPDELIYSTFT